MDAPCRGMRFHRVAAQAHFLSDVVLAAIAGPVHGTAPVDATRRQPPQPPTGERQCVTASCLSLGLALSLARPSPAQQAPAGREYPGLETGKMWQFDVPPLEYWNKRYGFQPPAGWLEHARLSALRYAGNCSASFVSGQGLVMTNHHCARECIESVTEKGEDFLANGFVAPGNGRRAALQDGLPRPAAGDHRCHGQGARRHRDREPPETAATLRAGVITAIEKECSATATDAFCQVVTLYRGRTVQALSLPALHRRAPRHGPREPDGLLRRRSRQLHLSPLRHRHVVRPRLRRWQARGHRASTSPGARPVRRRTTSSSSSATPAPPAG